MEIKYPEQIQPVLEWRIWTRASRFQAQHTLDHSATPYRLVMMTGRSLHVLSDTSRLRATSPTAFLYLRFVLKTYFKRYHKMIRSNVKIKFEVEHPNRHQNKISTPNGRRTFRQYHIESSPTPPPPTAISRDIRVDIAGFSSTVFLSIYSVTNFSPVFINIVVIT